MSFLNFHNQRPTNTASSFKVHYTLKTLPKIKVFKKKPKRTVSLGNSAYKSTFSSEKKNIYISVIYPKYYPDLN